MKLSEKVNGILHSVFCARVMRSYRNEVRSIKRIHPDVLMDVSSETERRHYDLWRRFDHKLNSDWLRLFNGLVGKEDPRFVPSTVYYGVVERVLNNCDGSMYGVEDKNLMSLYAPKKYRAFCVLRYVQGCFFDDDFNPLTDAAAMSALKNYDGDVVGKVAVGSSGGHSVVLYRNGKNGAKLSKTHELTTEWIKKNTSTYVVQERLTQEPEVSSLNPASINTCRIMTYRRPWDGMTKVGASMIRIGSGDALVDNISSGGMSVGIDAAGRLNATGCDCTYGKIFAHPKTGKAFKGVQIPFFAEMCNAVIEVAKRVPDCNILGFDVMARSNGVPCIVEINSTSLCAIEVQMSGPMFGDDTLKMAEWCAANKRFDKFSHLRTWY